MTGVESPSHVGKVLWLFLKLFLEDKRHYQTELACFLGCSPQTVMRLIAEIRRVVGLSLETGMEKHRRWYKLSPAGAAGGEYAEITRYLRLGRAIALEIGDMETVAILDQAIGTCQFDNALANAPETFAPAKSKPCD